MVQPNENVVLEIDDRHDQLFELVSRGCRVTLMRDGREVAVVEPTMAIRRDLSDTPEARKEREQAVAELLAMDRPSVNVSDEQIRKWRDEH